MVARASDTLLQNAPRRTHSRRRVPFLRTMRLIDRAGNCQAANEHRRTRPHDPVHTHAHDATTVQLSRTRTNLEQPPQAARDARLRQRDARRRGRDGVVVVAVLARRLVLERWGPNTAVSCIMIRPWVQWMTAVDLTEGHDVHHDSHDAPRSPTEPHDSHDAPRHEGRTTVRRRQTWRWACRCRWSARSRTARAASRRRPSPKCSSPRRVGPRARASGRGEARRGVDPSPRARAGCQTESRRCGQEDELLFWRSC